MSELLIRQKRLRPRDDTAQDPDAGVLLVET